MRRLSASVAARSHKLYIIRKLLSSRYYLNVPRRSRRLSSTRPTPFQKDRVIASDRADLAVRSKSFKSFKLSFRVRTEAKGIPTTSVCHPVNCTPRHRAQSATLEFLDVRECTGYAQRHVLGFLFKLSISSSKRSCRNS